MKKIKSIVLLFGICLSFALTSSNNFTPKDSNAWVGISYLYASNGGSAEGGAIIGVGAVADTALMEALAASIWGGPVGLAVGIGVGL